MDIRLLLMQPSVCKEANAKHLVVNHISARFLPSDIKEMLHQVEHYDFPIYIAEDFAEYRLVNGFNNINK